MGLRESRRSEIGDGEYRQFFQVGCKGRREIAQWLEEENGVQRQFLYFLFVCFLRQEVIDTNGNDLVT